MSEGGISRRRVLSVGAMAVGGLAAPFTLAGCGPKPTAASTKAKLLRVGWTSEPDTMNPFTYTSSASAEILQLVYDNLLMYDINLKPAPALATQHQLQLGRQVDHLHAAARRHLARRAAIHRRRRQVHLGSHEGP